MLIFLKSNLKYKLIIFLVLTLSLKSSLGIGSENGEREKKGKYIYSLNAQYGFIIIHRSYIQHFSQSHFSVFQSSISRQTNGNLLWHKLYNKPRVGFSMLYTNFAGNTILNSAFGAQGFIDFCKNIDKKNNLHFKLSCGIGYIMTPFNKDSNYKNIAIGSHFNGLVQLGLFYQFMINEKLQVGLNTSIIHFSNGAIRVPNLGINIASAGVSLHFTNTNLRTEKSEKLIDSLKQNRNFELFIGAGMKQNYPPSSTSFGVTSGRLQYYFKNKLKYSLSTGVDIFYDNGLHRKLLEDNLLSNDRKSAIQLGLNIQYQQNIHRISIPIFMGTYLYSNYKGNGFIYHGLGIKYKLSNQLSTAVILKTHYAKADYFLWGINYSLK